MVGKEEERDNCNTNGQGALDEEEPEESVNNVMQRSAHADIPAPSGKAVLSIKASKDTSSDQASKTGGNHVTSVKDGHSGRDLFLGVEEGQQEQCARVELE